MSPFAILVLDSFRYYDHYCSLVNVGGDQSVDGKCKRYTGVWKVYFNDKLMLTTTAFTDAVNKFDYYKWLCLNSREKQPQPGNDAIKKFTESQKT